MAYLVVIAEHALDAPLESKISVCILSQQPFLSPPYASAPANELSSKLLSPAVATSTRVVRSSRSSRTSSRMISRTSRPVVQSLLLPRARLRPRRRPRSARPRALKMEMGHPRRRPLPARRRARLLSRMRRPLSRAKRLMVRSRVAHRLALGTCDSHSAGRSMTNVSVVGPRPERPKA